MPASVVVRVKKRSLICCLSQFCWSRHACWPAAEPPGASPVLLSPSPLPMPPGTLPAPSRQAEALHQAAAQGRGAARQGGGERPRIHALRCGTACVACSVLSSTVQHSPLPARGRMCGVFEDGWQAKHTSQLDAMLATFAHPHCPPAASPQASRWIPTRLRHAPTASSPTSSTVSGAFACSLGCRFRLQLGMPCWDALRTVERAPAWLPCLAFGSRQHLPSSAAQPATNCCAALPVPCAGICNTGKLIVGIHVTTTEMTDGPPPQIQVRVRQVHGRQLSLRGWVNPVVGAAQLHVCGECGATGELRLPLTSSPPCIVARLLCA